MNEERTGTCLRQVEHTSGIYPWSFVTQIFHKGQPSHGGDSKTFVANRIHSVVKRWISEIVEE
jgi:hypothetical protein